MNSNLSSTQIANDEAGDYDGNDGEQGYHLPQNDFECVNDWYNPNSGGYYQPPQYYLSPDPNAQDVFDQERYAARLANYYQSVAEQNAMCAQQEAAHVQPKNDQLHQMIQQQSMLPSYSQLSAPAQSSTPAIAAMLAGQVGSQTAASAVLPILASSDMTVPAADLPEHTYSIYYPIPDPATVTQYVDPRVQQPNMCASTPLCTDLHQSMLTVKVHDARLLHKLHIKMFDSTTKEWSKWQRNFEVDMLGADVPCTSWVAIVSLYLDGLPIRPIDIGRCDVSVARPLHGINWQNSSKIGFKKRNCQSMLISNFVL